jgi:hypothetical protein
LYHTCYANMYRTTDQSYEGHNKSKSILKPKETIHRASLV